MRLAERRRIDLVDAGLVTRLLSTNGPCGFVPDGRAFDVAGTVPRIDFRIIDDQTPDVGDSFLVHR